MTEMRAQSRHSAIGVTYGKTPLLPYVAENFQVTMQLIPPCANDFANSNTP
ncbi:hypothetical protein Brsp05_04641 [Brucella sp. NBRC 12953]